MITIAMNPFDVIVARLFNQKHKGHLYQNPIGIVIIIYIYLFIINRLHDKDCPY